MSNEKQKLLNQLNKLHTTQMGAERIKKNLSLKTNDVVNWCKNQIRSNSSKVTKQGKNWYIINNDCIITVNIYSCTIITAHKK